VVDDYGKSGVAVVGLDLVMTGLVQKQKVWSNGSKMQF